MKIRKLTKKIRFEVFKRDNFTCQYCGKTPPAITLEVDHIMPISKGGNDDINNLITSCFGCNRGKGSIELKRITPALENNLEVLKEKEKQLKEYLKTIKKIELIKQKMFIEVIIIFEKEFKDKTINESFINSTINKFVNKIGLQEVKEAMNIACSRHGYDPESVLKYFCGICWKKIRKKDEGKL